MCPSSIELVLGLKVGVQLEGAVVNTRSDALG